MNTEQMMDRIELLEGALQNIFMSRRRDNIYGNMMPEWYIESENFEDFIKEMEQPW